MNCMGSNTSKRNDTRIVLDAIRGIVHALRESSRLAQGRVGLSGAQLFVLQRLAEAPAQSVNELAARTHTHQSSVSVVVARLVDGGLVRRAPAATDRRRVELTLTAKGRRAATGSPDVAQARLVEAVAALAPARRRQLAALLAEVAHTLTGSQRAPAMFFEERGRARAMARA